MSETRIKYVGLDIAKFVCALVILFYHFFSEHGPIPAFFEDILSLYAVCVALFMVISGFLLYDKLNCIDTKIERWKVVKKQIIRILQIYIIWSIPYILYSVSRWDFTSISPSFVFWKIQGWIFGSTFYTIWFMPSLAIGILISFFVIEMMPGWVVLILAALAYVFGSLNSTYSFLISDFPWYENVHSFVEIWMNGARGQFLFGFPLVTLGYYIAKHKINSNWIILGALSIISMGGLLAEALILRRIAGHTGIDMLLCMIPVTFFITEFLICLPIHWFNGCTWMRKMSVLIFMSQRIFLSVLPGLFVCIDKLYKNQILSFLIICGGTFLFSAVIIYASNRCSILKKLY